MSNIKVMICRFCETSEQFEIKNGVIEENAWVSVKTDTSKYCVCPICRKLIMTVVNNDKMETQR